MGSKKETREVVREAQRQGFRVKDTKSGWLLFPNDKSLPPVLVHKTPSDHRAWRNTLARLRRAGLVWPPP